MPEGKPGWGGARPGAGRPKAAPGDKAVRVNVTLTPQLAALFKELGGSKWLARMLQRCMSEGPRAN
ncbi:MAG: hypothetical protein HUK26_07325 [Duodenibacillus sp.]|nr:hypothetical protein [Duodenibacillus sp.]